MICRTEDMTPARGKRSSIEFDVLLASIDFVIKPLSGKSIVCPHPFYVLVQIVGAPSKSICPHCGVEKGLA